MPAWMFLAPPSAPARELAEVQLGGFLLQRIDRRDPSIPPIDERWALSDVFVLRSTREVEPWERRVASEVAEAFAEDLGAGPPREIELSGTPVTSGTRARPRAEPLDIDAFEQWLGTLRDAEGNVRDAALLDRVREAYVEEDEEDEDGGTYPKPAIRLARAKASPADVERLGERVRALFGADLPSDHSDFLLRVGALRWELVEEDGKTPIPATLLPAKSILRLLDEKSFVVMREQGDSYVPFFELGEAAYFGRRDYFALDASCDPMVVVMLGPDGRYPTHASFASWVGEWQRAGLLPRDIKNEPPEALTQSSRFADAAAVERAWRKEEERVRKMYEGGQH